jgi:hypothetical protein
MGQIGEPAYFVVAHRGPTDETQSRQIGESFNGSAISVSVVREIDSIPNFKPVHPVAFAVTFLLTFVLSVSSVSLLMSN